MSNARFIIDNIVDDAILTGTNASSDTKYTVENVKKISRSKVYRSQDTIFSTIKGNVTNKDVSAMVIGRHNFSDNVTYRLILYDGVDQTGNVLYDSTTTLVTPAQAATDLWEWGEFNWGSIAWGADKLGDTNRQFFNIILWIDIVSGVNSFTLELDSLEGGAAIPLYCNNVTIFCNDETIYCNATYIGEGGTGSVGIDYFQIGRLYIGEYVEPAYNISYGHGLSWDENTTQYRPNAGTLQSDSTTRNKKMEFNLNTIPAEDRVGIQKDLLSMGLSRDFFICLFPEDSFKQEDYSGIVKLTAVPKLSNFINTYYRSNYVVEEV